MPLSSARHLALLLAGAALVPQAHAASWAATATTGFPVAALLGAIDLGALPPSQPLTIRIGLAPQNLAGLRKLLSQQANPQSPNYRNYLTPTNFALNYGASPATISAVTAYLTNAGFTNIAVEPNRLLLSASASASTVAAAFNTTIEKIGLGAATGFVNLTPAMVPAKLGGMVTGVLGLNTIGQMQSTLRLPSVPQYAVSYTPRQFQAIYGATKSTPTGAHAAIAIMAEGDLTQVVADLRTAEAAFALPQVPVEIVPVGLPSTDTSGIDEWDLDTQYSTGIAQTVQQLYIYDTTSLTDSDLALEFSRFASDDLAKAGSASLGECEIFPYLDGSMAVDDMTFLEAAVQGQTFFASAGDTGSFCPVGPAGVNGVPIGAPLVNYPAASPYVVAVGGTSLLTHPNGSYDYEIAWYAGGGGVSQFESSPAWQSTKVTLLGLTADRGVPDIAMDADPESGATVYVDGKPEGVGGTSLSSPLSLGSWARVAAANPAIGNAGAQLYSLSNPTRLGGLLGNDYPHGGFHDITLGVNGLYPATPGYDLTTGLGTLVIRQLVKDLK